MKYSERHKIVAWSFIICFTYSYLSLDISESLGTVVINAILNHLEKHTLNILLKLKIINIVKRIFIYLSEHISSVLIDTKYWKMWSLEVFVVNYFISVFFESFHWTGKVDKNLCRNRNIKTSVFCLIKVQWYKMPWQYLRIYFNRPKKNCRKTYKIK